jgi:hypothetical protein
MRHIGAELRNRFERAKAAGPSHIAHAAGFVEPLEGCLSFAEARVYERERRYKPGFFAQGFFPVSLM